MADNAQAVNEEVESGATATESAPVENDTSITADNAFDDNAFDDVEEASEETDSANDNETEQPRKSEDTEETKAEQPKDGEKPKEWEELADAGKNRFQALANKNRELAQELERIKSQETQVATEQDLLSQVNPQTGEYFTPAEAERAARQQALEETQQAVAQHRYDLEVQQSQENIGRESLQALKDFPMLDAQSKDFNPTIASQFDALVGENLIYELPDGSRYPANVLVANGINPDTQARLLGSNISPYKLAKLIADSTKVNEHLYQANAQRSTEQMLANADTPGGNSQARGNDADLDEFDKAWDE